MPHTISDRRIQSAIEAIEPGGTLQSLSPLPGGNSATVSVADVLLASGVTKRLVIRTPSAYRQGEHADAAWREFAMIKTMQGHGVPVQQPRFLESLQGTSSDAFYIVDYCDGAPDLSPEDRDAYLDQYAAALAQVHRVDWQNAGVTFLSDVGHGSPETRAAGATRFRADDIRRALRRKPLSSRANEPVLCHGDFWPGNLLWREGKLQAIIDWEESILGEPLFDLSICRLDLLWILGMPAVEHFTARYADLTGHDLANLPYWDLVVSLRPIHGIEQWAAAYPHLGRADVTAETMIAGHASFVTQAIDRWHMD